MIKRIIFGYFFYRLLKEDIGIGKILKSDWVEVKPKRPDIPINYAKRKPGAYIIKGKKTIIYIGFSENVHEAVYKHFDPQSGSNQYSYEHQIQILLTNTISDAENLCNGLIKKLKPMDYEGNYQSIKITDEIETIMRLYDDIC